MYRGRCTFVIRSFGILLVLLVLLASSSAGSRTNGGLYRVSETDPCVVLLVVGGPGLSNIVPPPVRRHISFAALERGNQRTLIVLQKTLVVVTTKRYI